LLLELILARSGSWGETAALSDTPWSLTGTAVETVGAHPYALAYAPFYELFAPDYHEQFLAWSAGLRYGGYTPSVGALFSRGIESSAWSLIIPTSMEVSIARPAERDQDAVSTAHEAEVTARFIAPNLFGRLGTTPLLRFYDTDEFQSKISAILLRTGSGVWSTQFEVEQQSQFFWSDGRELEVDTTARLTAGDQISNDLSSIISYRWKTAYTQSAVEFLPTDGSLLHTERLELGANGDGLGVQLVSALFRHTTSATLGESGTLSLDAGLGLARSYAPVAYWIVGAELAVEVAISF
jgi:hypothetical protein